MRAAAIDIGTNTTLLLVAERDPGQPGTLRSVFESAAITRLGQGVDKSRVFAPEAIARTTAALVAHAGAIRDHGVERVRVVGTSAMRDAKGAEPLFAAVREQLGVEIEIVVGDEEARLAFRGAMSGLPSTTERALVLDVGGGSTELVFGRGHIVEQGRSFDVGSVRMTERHLRSDPPSAAEMGELEAAVREIFGAWTSRSHVLIGVAGTVTTIAAIHLGLATYDGSRVHGLRMARAEVEAIAARLAAMPLEARKAVAGLDPKRADVIVAGAAIVRLAMERVGADTLVVSDRGLRWALCEELLAG